MSTAQIAEQTVSGAGVHLPGHPMVGMAILTVLSEHGGACHRQEVYAPAANALGLTPEQQAKVTPSGANAWTVRVNFSRLYLANAGLLKSTGGGIWTITPQGESALKSSDSVQSIKAAYSAYKSAKKTTVDKHSSASDLGDQFSEANASGLVQLASHTSAPEQFESAVANAFRTLGFDATHIGGSGETDVLTLAERAKPPFSTVIDTKTTTHSKVGDSQIHWHHIEQHRKSRGADYAAVVAIGFHGGLVAQKAVQDQVALISAANLEAVLKWHARVQFSQEELRTLFVPTADGSPDVKALEAIVTGRLTRWATLVAVVHATSDYTAGSDESVSAVAIHAYLKAKVPAYGLADAPTLNAVAEAMTFLGSTFIDVLSRDSDATFRLLMTPATALHRLSRIGEQAADWAADKP